VSNARTRTKTSRPTKFDGLQFCNPSQFLI
jgi:hypothetical protein